MMPSEEQTPSNVCRVGYAMNPKKLRKGRPVSGAGPVKEGALSVTPPWRGGGLADLLEQAHEGIVFEPFNYDEYSNQKFDVIIHKLTEDLDSSEPDSLKVKALKEFLLLNPETVIVDPLESVRTVVSRARTCLVLRNLINSTPNCSFTHPNFAIAESPLEIRSAIVASKLRYPVICKPIEACGTPNSHSMVVALSDEGLSLVTCPCIIQEYINHDESLFKVYVIDSEVMVFRRPSLPNLEMLTKHPATTAIPELSTSYRMKSLAFDSRYAYPTAADFFDSTMGAMNVTGAGDVPALCLDHTDMTPGKLRVVDKLNQGQVICEDNFNEAARLISATFGLSLFGFDVIIPASAIDVENSTPLVVIDVNFFPSYKEVIDFPEKLCQFLKRRANASKLV